MIKSSACPSCNSLNVKFFNPIKDHSVSSEVFPIFDCQDCELRFTNEIPDEFSIGPYYQSENYISHTNSDKGIFNKAYQFVRKYALHGKRRLISTKVNLKSGSLLDYGCGTGSFLQMMKQSGWRISGIEPDSSARSKANEMTGEVILNPRQLNEVPSDSFDIITLWHVLEHVHQIHQTLSELKRVLKKEGKIFIAVPNFDSFDAQFYGLFWAAYDVPRHLYHFNASSLSSLLTQHGLKVISIKQMWFDSFYVSLLSEKYLKNPLGFFRAIFVGLVSNLFAAFNPRKCSSIIYLIEKKD